MAGNELEKDFERLFGEERLNSGRGFISPIMVLDRLIAVARAAIKIEQHGSDCNSPEFACVLAHTWNEALGFCTQCGLSREETVCDCGKDLLHAELQKLLEIGAAKWAE